MTDLASVVVRLRSRYAWFDHALRARTRFQEAQGSFYAAGITYFTILALWPVLMVAFAAVGMLLASRPHLLASVDAQVKAAVTQDFATQVISLMDEAIDSRASIGIIGLATAAWVGLGWMTHVREAMSQMWGQCAHDEGIEGMAVSKLSDLLALISAFVATLVSIGLSALTDADLMRRTLDWIGAHHAAAADGLLRAVSLMMSMSVAWAMFTWMIARLPRHPMPLRQCVTAGLLASVIFELFKQVESIYLHRVIQGPAGATFGPVLGLMVFAYICAGLVLFATAWAATSPGLRADPA